MAFDFGPPPVDYLYLAQRTMFSRLKQITALMKLRYDPYQVFRFSKTPAGLYARQKWLGEAETPQWKTDFQEMVTALLADQLPDGSWHHETVATIKHFPTIFSAPWWCILSTHATRLRQNTLHSWRIFKQTQVIGVKIFHFTRH
jgi:hypothetical protein